MQQPDRAGVDCLFRFALIRFAIHQSAVFVAHFQDHHRVDFPRPRNPDVAPLELDRLPDRGVIVRTDVRRGVLEILERDVLRVGLRPDHLPHVRNRRVHVGHVDCPDVRTAGRDRSPVRHRLVVAECRVEVLAGLGDVAVKEVDVLLALSCARKSFIPRTCMRSGLICCCKR